MMIPSHWLADKMLYSWYPTQSLVAKQAEPRYSRGTPPLAAVAFLTPREQQGSFGRGPLQAVFEVGWAFDLEAHCLYHHHSGCSDSVDGQT